MPKNSKKRQRLDNPPKKKSQASATLERLLDDDSKDDEERRLESMLFGVPYMPSSKGTVLEDEDEDGGRPMAALLDSDLFFVDDALPHPHLSQKSESLHSASDSDSEAESEPDSQPSSVPHPTQQSIKKAAWTDSSTSASTKNEISLLNGPSRLRKLRHFMDEDTITEKEYESRLRTQFERINPEPAWAQRTRKRNRKARGIDDERPGDTAGEEEEGEEDWGNLFTSTNGILKATESQRKKHVALPSGTISIERLRDANLSTQSTASGAVKIVSFHPSERVPLLCVGTADRRIRLYNVDGHTSPLLQTLHVPSLPLTSPTSALFHPSGSSLLISGPRPYFLTHDLQTGSTLRHDRGLWGTTFSHSGTTNFLDTVGTKRSRSSRKSSERGEGVESVHLTSFSPDGDLLAVAAGKGAQVHLVDWKSGAGQVVGSLKCATGSGGVSGLWWFDPSSLPSSHDGSILGETGKMDQRKHLAVLTSDAEVYLWDVAERRCVRRWKDEGGFRGAGRVLAGSQTSNSGHLAVGSSSGLVNIYNSSAYSLHDSNGNPKPIKSIGNLTTAISSIKFNHDAQLLAIASREKKDAMRLIHIPTLTSFANWPTQSTPLGNVTAIDFSPRSEYVVIGNTRGRALLYHLREYGAGV